MARPQGYRAERVAEEIRNEVSLMLAGELKDPRLAGDVNITEVRWAPGMRTIRIFVHAGRHARKSARRRSRACRRPRDYVRHELVDRLHMRRAPEVLFMLDQTEEIEKRINELLQKPGPPEKPNPQRETKHARER